MNISEWFSHLSHWVSGVPSLALLIIAGLYLTLRFSFIQIRAYRYAFSRLLASNKEDEGEVSPLQALSTVLSGTIGTGNIAGVATAITLGGPGAIFWMWITALLGMATKFASCTLGHRFRQKAADGVLSGGPIFTLKHGLNMPGLANILAVVVIFGTVTTGGLVQTNSIADGLGYIFPQTGTHGLLIGAVCAVFVGVVIVGGIQRIGRFAVVIVPFMAVLYCLSALVILMLNAHQIPHALMTIIQGAFNPAAIGGGTIGAAIQYGVARGLYSSEAGLGTAPIGLSAAKSHESIEVGLLGMLGPLLDTIIICTMTALVILVMGAWGAGQPAGLESASLSAYAFGQGLAYFGDFYAHLGQIIVGFGLILFSYTTMITWSYYGERSACFLGGQKMILPYRLLFLSVLVVGAILPIRLVWQVSDIVNVLMAIPNLLSVVLLSSLVKSMAHEYFLKYSPKLAFKNYPKTKLASSTVN